MEYSYNIGIVLGTGTFGVTYLADDNFNKQKVAVKMIDIAKSSLHGEDIESIKQEIETLSVLSTDPFSKYVVRYLNSFEQKIDVVMNLGNGSYLGTGSYVGIVTEYIAGKSLKEKIQRRNFVYKPKFLVPLYLQLLLGLKFIHEKGYAHRDIKPGNIMVTSDNTIKYIDFGIACMEQIRPEQRKCFGMVGTPQYMPPEYFNINHKDSLVASQAHDMWSLGVVMFQMANGFNSFPFVASKNIDGNLANLDFKDLRLNIARAPYIPSKYKHDSRIDDYLHFLNVNDWRLRPTIHDALSFFEENIISIM